MQPSLKTIAKLVGVTEATVSMALRHTGSISARRRQEILEIARELNYTPNLVARGLSTGRSHLVGLVSATSYVEVTSDLMDHFERTMRRHEYQLIGSFHQGLKEIERRNIRDLMGRKVDAVAGFPVAGEDFSAWEALKNARVPFVVFNETFPFPHNRILIDFEDGARQTVEHLLALGRKNLAFVCTATTSYHVRKRIQGWRRACEEANIDFDRLPMFSSPESGTVELLQNLTSQQLNSSKKIDGLVAANDLIAIAALQSCHRKGVRVPEDVAVVGFDDSRVASLLPIPLTSVRQPTDEAALIAAEILLRVMEDPKAKPREVILKPKLVIRESTGAPPALASV